MLTPDQLAALPLFAGAKPAALAMLASRSMERRFAVDEVLFLAGTSATHLLIVTEGLVRVVRGHDHRQFLVHREGVGGALGEVPLFANGTYPATAIADEPTRCVQVSMAALRDAVAEDSELAFVFLGRLAQRIRTLVEQLDRLGAQSIEVRVARLILRQQERRKPGESFLLGRTQTVVAEELGTVREVLVRALRELRSLGAIEATGRGYYRVVNLAVLKVHAEE